MKTPTNKATHQLPWNRYKMFLGFYALFALTAAASALIGFKIAPGHHPIGAVTTALLIAGVGLLFTRECRVPRLVVATIGRHSSAKRMRQSGICPQHGLRAIENRARPVFEDSNEFHAGHPYCTACGKFIENGEQPKYLNRRAQPI